VGRVARGWINSSESSHWNRSEQNVNLTSVTWSRKKSKLRTSRKGGSIRSVLRSQEPGAGGAIIKLPPGAGAVITNCGSGSLLFYQRIGRIIRYRKKSWSLSCWRMRKTLKWCTFKNKKVKTFGSFSCTRSEHYISSRGYNVGVVLDAFYVLKSHR
jgi:hypothetical protein